MLLFEDEFGEGNQEQDNTEIKSTLLYFSGEEHSEFKRLVKKAIESNVEDKFKDGNISDIILIILRREYGS
jgi:hypothetical protein